MYSYGLQPSSNKTYNIQLTYVHLNIQTIIYYTYITHIKKARTYKAEEGLRAEKGPPVGQYAPDFYRAPSVVKILSRVLGPLPLYDRARGPVFHPGPPPVRANRISQGEKRYARSGRSSGVGPVRPRVLFRYLRCDRRPPARPFRRRPKRTDIACRCPRYRCRMTNVRPETQYTHMGFIIHKYIYIYIYIIHYTRYL